MNEQREPDGEFIAEWQGHAGTEWFARTLHAAAGQALVNLIGAARLSSDPRVTAAVMYYDTLNKTIRTVTEKPQRGDDETDPATE